MRHGKVAMALWTGAVGLLGIACEDDQNYFVPVPGSEIEAQGIKMLLAVGADSGVTGIKFEITPVACSGGTPVGAPITVERPLADVLLPGGLAQFDKMPLDPGSKHLFADSFQAVAPGCYDVKTTPVTTKAVTCLPAHALGVKVLAGKTTEVLLINQCPSVSAGAIDVAATINRGPRIRDLTLPTSKFGATCELEKICVTADDPDGDPLEIVWSAAAVPAHTPLQVLGREVNADGSISECATIIPHASGRIDAKVTVYDQLHDGGNLERIERWLAAHGSSATSSASLEFPIYATKGRTPVAEVCSDSVDNDCDGLTDRDDTADCDACSKKFDVTLLVDLSGSFYDDLPRVKSFAPSLFSGLTAASPGARFGVTSFVDKPVYPFGSIGDYVFSIHQPLGASAGPFTTSVNSLTTRYGADRSESQIEALALLARNGAGLGYTPDSLHVVVLATDAPFHKAGDCTPAIGGCTSPNNGDAVADPREDFPSVADVKTAVQTGKVIPIFAVAEDGGFPLSMPTYTTLAADLGFPGNVVPLVADSSNLQKVILAAVEKACAPR